MQPAVSAGNRVTNLKRKKTGRDGEAQKKHVNSMLMDAKRKKNLQAPFSQSVYLTEFLKKGISTKRGMFFRCFPRSYVKRVKMELMKSAQNVKI